MRLFRPIVLAAFGCLMAATASASAEELKFANYMAPTHPYVAGAFQPFADELAAATGNAVTVKLYNGGELGAGPTDQFARVVDGVAELAVGPFGTAGRPR